MNILSRFKNDLADFLKQQLFAEGISVVTEFPSARRAAPPKNGCIAVGLAGVERPGAPAGLVKLILRFDLLCPADAKTGCHALFDRLCELLLCGGGPSGVSAVQCGELVFDRELGGLRLSATATATGLLLSEPETEGEPFTDLMIETKGV